MEERIKIVGASTLNPNDGFMMFRNSNGTMVQATKAQIQAFINGDITLDDLTLTGFLTVAGVVTGTNTTASTSSTTGAMILSGGVGVAKAIFSGAGITATTTLKSGDGTVALPAIGPTSDPDSGLYVIGANNLGVAVNGAKVLDIATTGLGITGAITATTSISATTSVTVGTIISNAVGAVGAPSYTFTGDTNTGLYWVSADSFAATANGANVVVFATTGITVTGTITTTGSVGIGASPNAVTILDLTSTTQGLRVPRQTTAQRTAITTTNLPGIIVFDTDINGVFYTANDGSWVQV